MRIGAMFCGIRATLVSLVILSGCTQSSRPRDSESQDTLPSEAQATSDTDSRLVIKAGIWLVGASSQYCLPVSEIRDKDEEHEIVAIETSCNCVGMRVVRYAGTTDGDLQTAIVFFHSESDADNFEKATRLSVECNVKFADGVRRTIELRFLETAQR